MQYLSPAKFTGESTFSPLDKKAIQLARKKLFADLELGGETTIELNGVHFSKNDIILYFEDLLKEDVLSYHNAVGGDGILLRFLEEAKIEKKERFQTNPLYENEQFIQWISPFFSDSFKTFMEGCLLGETEEDSMIAMLVNPLLMTGKDLEQAWESVSRIILNNIAILERFGEMVKAKYMDGSVAPTQARDLMEFRYIRLLQLLPQGRFSALKDKYAHAMLVTCIAIFNSHIKHRNHVRTWLENAELLADSESVKSEINKKMQEMERIQTASPAAAAQRNKEDSSSGAGVLKIAVVVLIFIIRLATCKSHSSNYSSGYEYQHSTPKYQIDTSILRILREQSRPKHTTESEGEASKDEGIVAPPDDGIYRPKSNNHLDTSKASITYKIKRHKHK
ncbi:MULTISPECIES: hypothetical protein [Niastella]|uniref:Uncharacterized protein n=1 Tax=Niastella soli TaxID=2821487 RepID=A0ABS3YLB2_9BACT|nr:hypothetical protein [Niastella soli]MBO9198679.1 hypothetical protein [Niastella soli]